MEYLRGGWLVESCWIKDQRWGWCSCTASSKKNYKSSAVPVSCEWNTQGTLDAFWWLKTSPGERGRGKRNVSNISFFLFLFRAESATIWDVTWAGKVFGSDPFGGLMGQSSAGALGHWDVKNNSIFSRGLGVVSPLFKELCWRHLESRQSPKKLIISFEMEVTIVPSLLSDSGVIFSLLCVIIFHTLALQPQDSLCRVQCSNVLFSQGHWQSLNADCEKIYW